MVGLIVGAVVVGAILGLALGRWAVWLGVACLVFGLGQFAAVYVYQVYFFTGGDTSGLGMLTTLCLISFVPLGLILIVFGLLRSQ